jgi:hypothetical protein
MIKTKLKSKLSILNFIFISMFRLDFFEGVTFTKAHEKGRGFFHKTPEERKDEDLRRLGASARRADRRAKRIAKVLEKAEKRRETRGQKLESLLLEQKSKRSMNDIIERK